ncbi:MAG: hypothetical protein NVSMB30_01930 [Hymenobacter sp.]
MLTVPSLAFFPRNPVPTVQDLAHLLEAAAPLAYQESYDNAGLQCGNPQAEITGVLIALDCTPAVVAEAQRRGCNVVVAHHTVIFRPLKRLTGATEVEQTLIAALKNDVAIYAAHTNLDNKKSELDTIVGENEEEERGIMAQRDEATKPVEDRLLTAYTRIRGNVRNGLAVVLVRRDACGGCFNTVPPQRQADIISHKKIIVCEHCGRILADVEARAV